jgi:sporulation protein YlmC with PRC-barrel domain
MPKQVRHDKYAPMLVSHKKLIGLSVETQSGERVGEVVGFILDAETQTIYQYQVRPAGLSGIFAKELLIHRQQVINITEEKMTVDDLVYKKLAGNQSPLIKKQAVPSQA